MIDINAYFEDKLLVLHNFFSLFMFYGLILNFHLDFGSINYYPKDGPCCNTRVCNVIGPARCTIFWLALKSKLKPSLIWFNLGLFERSLIFLAVWLLFCFQFWQCFVMAFPQKALHKMNLWETACFKVTWQYPRMTFILKEFYQK